jgi:hypothetical protein
VPGERETIHVVEYALHADLGPRQVLVRPDLINAFRADQLRILGRAGDTALALHDGRPDKKGVSDHFPLLFKLDL